MRATPFDLDAPLGQRRAIIRREGVGVEMVELAWGLKGREGETRPFTVVRSEGRRFPTHRCLVPASEFRFRSRGQTYSFSLADGDWFYFAGIWRPAKLDWPEAYGILTVAANDDVAPYHDRQMAVLTRAQRMDWLDATMPEEALLRPLPHGSFRVREIEPHDSRQHALAM
ncbi:SOS response-associated peptidase family protein [Bradyrhizobium sp. USDA 4473]